MLLKRHVADPRSATDQQILLAAKDTIPNVPVMFWLFRIMAGLGFFFIGFFALAFYCASACKFSKPWFLKIAVAIMPLPWIAIEFGWMLAEIGRQPWAVEGVLPTFLAASSLSISQIWTTIIGFTLLYGTLAVIEVRLMIATIRKGPVEHHEPETSRGQTGYAPLPAE
jgi:cytochrome d ubiquinol oxidase subunit I